MSTKVHGSSGTAQSSSGTTENTTENQTASASATEATSSTTQNEPLIKDPAAFLAKHQEILSEKKKLSEEAARLARELRERDEALAKNEGNVKKLLEIREQELKEAREEAQKFKGEFTGLKGQLDEGLKLRAFLDNVPGQLGKQYYGLIPLDEIAVDPETGLPDEASVQMVAKKFTAEYSEVIQKPNEVKLENDAAQGASKELGYTAEIRKAKTQKEFDAIRAKYGRA